MIRHSSFPDRRISATLFVTQSPRFETDKAYAFPRVSAHLGSLEVSSNNSCNVLVSGAVWQADLCDIYRGTAVDCGEDVCRLSFWRCGRRSLISIICAILSWDLAWPTPLRTGPTLSRATQKFFDTQPWLAVPNTVCRHTLSRLFCTTCNSSSHNIPFLIHFFHRKHNTTHTLR